MFVVLIEKKNVQLHMVLSVEEKWKQNKTKQSLTTIANMNEFNHK